MEDKLIHRDLETYKCMKKHLKNKSNQVDLSTDYTHAVYGKYPLNRT